MVSKPAVTVLMPVYNGELFLRDAIYSVLNQSYKNFELLIINDGSTDDSVKIIEEFKDSRIRLLENSSNLGLVQTRNRGLIEANGKYIAMLDCDDLMHPERLSIQVDFLEKNPSHGLVGTWFKVINDKGEIIDLVKPAINHQRILLESIFQNQFAQSSVMIRTDLREQFQYSSKFPPAEDYELWTRISQKLQVANLPYYLTYYRIHSNNISTVDKQTQLIAIKEILRIELDQFGVPYSKSELELHLSICLFTSSIYTNLLFDSEEELKEAHHWLNKLFSFLRKKEIFDENLSCFILCKRWLKILELSNIVGYKKLIFLFKKNFFKWNIEIAKIYALFILRRFLSRNLQRKLKVLLN